MRELAERQTHECLPKHFTTGVVCDMHLEGQVLAELFTGRHWVCTACMLGQRSLLHSRPPAGTMCCFCRNL